MSKLNKKSIIFDDYVLSAMLNLIGVICVGTYSLIHFGLICVPIIAFGLLYLFNNSFVIALVRIQILVIYNLNFKSLQSAEYRKNTTLAKLVFYNRKLYKRRVLLLQKFIDNRIKTSEILEELLFVCRNLKNLNTDEYKEKQKQLSEINKIKLFLDKE